MYKKRYFLVILFVLLWLIFFIINYYCFWENHIIFSSNNQINSIYLSGNQKEYKNKFNNIKLEDKISINIRFNFKKTEEINKNLLKIDWKINSEKLYLNYNVCDYNIWCDTEFYELDLLYNNYFFIKKIKTNKFKKTNKNTYSFWSISIVNNNKNVILDEFNWFSIIKNKQLLNLLLLWKQIRKIDIFYFCIICFVVILFFFLYKVSLILFKKYGDFFYKNFIYFYVFFIIIWFFVCLLQLYLSDYFIIYDEYYSWVTIRQSFTQIIKSTMWDVHPPFYYFYLKLNSIIFWNNIIVLKILNVFLIFPIFYFLYKLYFIIFKNNYKKILFITISFLIINIYFLMFASLIRMYFFWIFIFVTSSYFLINYLNSILLKKENKINLIFYILFATIWLYTHNYFIFFNLAQFIYVLYFLYYYKIIKTYYFKIIISYIIIWLLYLPWFFILLKQSESVSNDYWIHKLNIVDVSQFLINIFLYFHNNVFEQNIFLVNNLFVNVFVVFIFIYFVYKFFINYKKNIFAHYSIFVILIPILISIFYSIFKTAIFSERYFLFWLVFYFSLLSILKYKKLYIIYFVLFVFFIQNLGIRYLDNYNFDKDINKNYMFILENEKPDIIINKNISTLVVFDYINRKNNYDFINSIYNDTSNKNSDPYNWRSLFYRYKSVANNNLNVIKNKKILVINYWNPDEELIIPKNWKIYKNVKNSKIPYTIYENFLTK